MSAYIKTISALLGGISAWGITAIADGAISPAELFGLLGVFGTALAVFHFPNRPPADQDASVPFSGMAAPSPPVHDPPHPPHDH